MKKFLTLAVMLISFMISFCSPGNEMKNVVTEVVIYRVNQDNLKDFSLISEKVNGFLSLETGYISRKTLQNHKESNQFIDLVEWKTIEDADRVAQKIQGDENFAQFFSLIEKVESFHHYKSID